MVHKNQNKPENIDFAELLILGAEVDAPIYFSDESGVAQYVFFVLKVFDAGKVDVVAGIGDKGKDQPFANG